VTVFVPLHGVQRHDFLSLSAGYIISVFELKMCADNSNYISTSKSIVQQIRRCHSLTATHFPGVFIVAYESHSTAANDDSPIFNLTEHFFISFSNSTTISTATGCVADGNGRSLLRPHHFSVALLPYCLLRNKHRRQASMDSQAFHMKPKSSVKQVFCTTIWKKKASIVGEAS
jgi:hypothetical protein